MNNKLTPEQMEDADAVLAIVTKYDAKMMDIEVIIGLLKIFGLTGERTMKALKAMVEIAELKDE
jgi:hypothetical protein